MDGNSALSMVGSLLDTAMWVVGGLIAGSAAYKMSEHRKKGQPGDDSEWWAVAQGAALIAIGVGGFISKLIGSLHIG